MKTFNRKIIKPGMIIAVKGNHLISIMIRWCLNKWLRRLCIKLGLNAQYYVFGNHTAMFISHPKTNELAIGEALLCGNVVTSIEEYDKRISSGEIAIKVFEVIYATDHDNIWAANNWWKYEKGKPYDFLAYGRLIIKSLFIDFADSKNSLLQWIGNSAAGWEWANWCTEAVAEAWKVPPNCRDIFQTTNATPLQVEQCAGLLPQKPDKWITLREITNILVDI